MGTRGLPCRSAGCCHRHALQCLTVLGELGAQAQRSGLSPHGKAPRLLLQHLLRSMVQHVPAHVPCYCTCAAGMMRM